MQVADLEGITTARAASSRRTSRLEEGGVHPELYEKPAAEGRPQAVDHLAQEGDNLLGVVHIAGPILHRQDVTSLGDACQQG